MRTVKTYYVEGSRIFEGCYSKLLYGFDLGRMSVCDDFDSRELGVRSKEAGKRGDVSLFWKCF